MDNNLKEIIWNQFGAAIDMIENAVNLCPNNLWGNRSQQPEFWYLVYHTLFWLDFYLTATGDKFLPPLPFTLSELDPEGILPERVYTKDEMLKYLEFGRKECKETIKSLDEEKSKVQFVYGSINLNFVELLFYNMRHVQHHSAQLNLMLRQKIDDAPRWVKQAKEKMF